MSLASPLVPITSTICSRILHCWTQTRMVAQADVVEYNRTLAGGINELPACPSQGRRELRAAAGDADPDSQRAEEGRRGSGARGNVPMRAPRIGAMTPSIKAARVYAIPTRAGAIAGILAPTSSIGRPLIGKWREQPPWSCWPGLVRPVVRCCAIRHMRPTAIPPGDCLRSEAPSCLRTSQEIW